jgi:hypothetical protein
VVSAWALRAFILTGGPASSRGGALNPTARTTFPRGEHCDLDVAVAVVVVVLACLILVAL